MVTTAAILLGTSACLGPGALAQQGGRGGPVQWTTRTDPVPIRPAPPPALTLDSDRPALRRIEPAANEPVLAPGAASDAASTEPTTADASTEPQLPVDGVLDTPEPQAPVDGLDAAAQDTRAEEDVRAFQPNDPPTGFDPAIFSIEPDPIADRRPGRLARLDPYEPIGVRIGSFLLFPEIEIAGAAFNNVLRSPTNARRDIALETRPSLRLVSTWPVHAIELNARGLASFHQDFPSEDDRNSAIEARGRLDVTRRTNIEGGIGREITQETRGTINSRATAGGRTDVTTERAQIALNHRFNRLQVQLRGAVSETDFAPTTGDTGAVITNRDRDITRREGAARATWSFRPDLGVFGEVGLDDRSYVAASLSDGLRRDSDGERGRVGVSFGSTDQNIRGEASIGTARQRYDERRLKSVSGIIVDANLAWRVTGLTTVLVTANSDVAESTIAGSGGGLGRSGGVEVRHAFRRHIVGSLGTRVTQTSYAGVSLSERDWTTSAGVDYFLSPEITLFGRFAHVDFATSAANGDYTADEVRVGVRVRR